MIGILHELKGKSLDKKREIVIKEAEASLDKLKGIAPYRGGKEYLEKTIEIIEYFRNLCKGEFARIARMYNKESLSKEDAEYIYQVYNDYNSRIKDMIYEWNLSNQLMWKSNIDDI